ncbi:hypothetical protein [Limosilactobacillus coleohominis]|uniref:hypothetical protein n=1 Tax=Limosilactobacillus coleohominis TaxID=181675 RepID=UPI0026ECBA79|nr:hypothetical protein [Limosilactobacillus coleohominis]
MTVTSNNDEVRRMIILDQGTDTELGIVGLGYSPDNGTHFFVTNTIKGRVFRKQDVETLWPLLKDKIQNVMDGSLSVSWADIQNKPDVALRSELPDMSNYVTHDQLPAPVDLSGYAKIGDIPSLNGYAKLTDIPSIAGLVKEAELDNYVKKGEIPEVDLSGYAKITDLIGYAKKSDIPQTMTWGLITGKPDVATQDDISYLKTLIGSGGSGDAGLSIEAISELIKHHLKASVNAQTGNLEIDVDGVTNGSIADTVATKVAQSLKFELQGSQLFAEIGGTE